MCNNCYSRPMIWLIAFATFERPTITDPPQVHYNTFREKVTHMTIIKSRLSWLQRQPIGMRYLMTHFAWRLCGWVFFILAVSLVWRLIHINRSGVKYEFVYLCNVNYADPYLSSPCPTNYRRKVWCGFGPSFSSSNQSPPPYLKSLPLFCFTTMVTFV